MTANKYFVMPDLEAKRDAQAKRRADAIRDGMCVRCCKRPHEPNVTKCAECECGGKSREHRRTWLKQPDKFNVSCQAHAFHRSDCKRLA